MNTKLSVNINKIATLRNSRGGDLPSVVEAAIRCQMYGAQGITVHPRPDERHIRYKDVKEIKPLITTEFNVEGNPKYDSFVQLVLDVKPHQVTLVPDSLDALTSNNGWDTISEKKYLTEIISEFKKAGIRTSIFLNPDVKLVSHAAETGADRIELYTEDYAKHFLINKKEAIKPYIETAIEALKFNLGINAGHDLSLLNLKYFAQKIPNLLEVSIGHALIADALYLGMEKTIQNYLAELK